MGIFLDKIMLFTISANFKSYFKTEKTMKRMCKIIFLLSLFNIFVKQLLVNIKQYNAIINVVDIILLLQ